MKFLKQAQNFLEQRAGSINKNEALLTQSRFWMRSITWGLIGTTGFAVAWLSLARTDEIIVASGSLQPIGSVRDIQMPLGGIVDEILVKDGDEVEAGDVVMRLDTETSSQKQKSLQKSLSLKENQLELKKLESKRVKNLTQDRIKTLTEKVKFEKEILFRYKMLAKEGAVAELQYLQQRNTVQEVEGRLRESKLDGLRQEAIQHQQIQLLLSELANLQSQLTETEVTLRYQSLRSPVDGIVFDLKPKNPGYAGQGTEPLMKIVPFNALEAKVEISSSDIGFVRKGMEVDISIDSFPASDFGALMGKVDQLGSDALAPDQAKQRNEYRFPALIKFDAKDFKLKDGKYIWISKNKNLPLQVGMSLTANIKLRKVSYLQLLLGSFKDKAAALKRF